VTANAGYFYVGAYSPDELQVIVHPLTGAARVYDCDGCESVIAPSTSPALGSAAFAADGNSAGYNPCDSNPVPVIRTTWSRIKTMME
jgi:hypothetical protein